MLRHARLVRAGLQAAARACLGWQPPCSWRPAAFSSLPSPPRPASAFPFTSPAYATVIGLEVHCQLQSVSKLFSGSSSAFGSAANSQTSFVDAALPGCLPSLNAAAVALAIRTALLLGTEPQRLSRFERKHYVYADLPAGYQITQQQHPVVRGGALAGVRIDRVQLEQDSGKSLHELLPDACLLDLNRAGVALIEVVTQPDIRSSEQAAAFIRQLQQALSHCGVCRAQMEDGSMRVDVNVSLGLNDGEQPCGQRVEVKNLNSVRGVVRAIEFERQRQAALLSRGCAVARETRTFDARLGETRLLRSKEQLLDYRFMPEPDLPWLVISEEELQAARASMPDTPAEQRLRLVREYGLSEQEAALLQSEQGAADFFTRLVHGEPGEGAEQSSGAAPLRPPRLAYSWLTSELFGKLRRRLDSGVGGPSGSSGQDGAGSATDAAEDSEDASLPRAGGRRVRLLASSPVSSRQLGSLLDELQRGSISGKVGKQVLDRMLEGGGEQAAVIVQREGWQQSSDGQQLRAWVDAVLEREQADVQRSLRRHNPRFLGFLVAAVMQLSNGQANPREAAAELSRRLNQQQQQQQSSSSTRPQQR